MFKLLNLSPFREGSHRTLSSRSCENGHKVNICEVLLASGSSFETKCPRFFLGAGYICTPWLARFQSPKVKAGIQIKPPCLCNSLGYSKPIFSGVGTILRAKFPVINQDQSRKQVLLKTAASGLYVNFFLHRGLGLIFFHVDKETHVHIHVYLLANNWVRDALCSITLLKCRLLLLPVLYLCSQETRNVSVFSICPYKGLYYYQTKQFGVVVVIL